MREWPMFRLPREKRRHRARSASLDGKPLPRIADLVMERLAGAAAEKLAWLRAQAAAGKLDGDDPDEVAQAEALLLMLVRLSAARDGREKRHLSPLAPSLQPTGERDHGGGGDAKHDQQQGHEHEHRSEGPHGHAGEHDRRRSQPEAHEGHGARRVSR
jgi:hypothetical protein